MNGQETYIGNRYEFKYILPPHKAVVVERQICALSRVTADPHSKKGPYTVNSIYFDTPLMDDYADKDGSFLIRKKMRGRIYKPAWDNTEGGVSLEIKHKRNMSIMKERAPVSGNIWKELVNNGNTAPLLKESNSRSGKDAKTLKSFAYLFERGLYRPSAAIRYLRSAYLENFTSLVRVSFDKEVSISRPEMSHIEDSYINVSQNLTIMEIKYYGKMPWWFRHIISEHDLQRTTFSKYRNSVAVLRGRYRIPISK